MTGRGSIIRRGKKSWRLKFDTGADMLTGKRQTAYVTVKGTKQDAQQELTRRLAALDAGSFVAPTKTTLAEWLDQWLDENTTISGKTKERYGELIEGQVKPHLGRVLVQKLRPAQIQKWHTHLLKNGARKGGPLHARTVGHAHRVLNKAMSDAMKLELVPRNVVAVVAAPKVEDTEMEILSAPQIAEVMTGICDHALSPIVVVALGTGMRRGELLALRWIDVNLDAATLRIERALEETKEGGLRFKPPKTAYGKRTITLPATVVSMLRTYRRQQLELRIVLGLGKFASDALVFSQVDGTPRSPRRLTKQWSEAVEQLDLPKVSFHALRHTHASALIAHGVDVLTISRRLGHGSAAITLRIYSHIFTATDGAAATAMDAALGGL